MCGVPYHAADDLPRPARQEGLPRRHLRAGRGPAQGEGTGAPRGGAGRDARHVHRRRLSRCAGARLPDGGRARRLARRRCDPPGSVGVALLDLSTGEFLTAEYAGRDGLQALRDELAVLRPREILVPSDVPLDRLLPAAARGAASVTPVRRRGRSTRTPRGGRCSTSSARTSLEGFGLEGHPAAIRAAGALVHYLNDTQKTDLTHVRGVTFKEHADRLIVDPLTLKHLEIVEAMDGSRAGSLLHELDRTMTPMGARLLRTWLIRPLLSLERIRDRLDAVEDFAFRTTERGKFRDALRTMHDIERLVARTALGTAGPRDLVGAAHVARGRAPPPPAALGVPGAVRVEPRRRARRRGRRAGGHRARRSSTSRPRSRARAATSAPAWTRSSTTCGASRRRANR